jgi:hypothetical protein
LKGPSSPTIVTDHVIASMSSGTTISVLTTTTTSPGGCVLPVVHDTTPIAPSTPSNGTKSVFGNRMGFSRRYGSVTVPALPCKAVPCEGSDDLNAK